MEMMYFANNRTVRFGDLRQAVDKEGKRIYSEELVQKIESGDFNYLNNINLLDRNNRYFMEPLLYAVKNSEFATYEIYKYYGEELQKEDLTMAAEVVINEPEVIENTAVANNDTIVLYLVKFNPEIIMYISEDLKNNGEFIEELCETGDKEAIMYAARECNISQVLEDNPSLASNPDFMKEAIKEDSSLLRNADESLKNNYEFIKEVSNENYQVVGYIIDNEKQFDIEAIRGAKDTTKRLTVENSKAIINDMAQTSDDARYVKVAKKLEERGENNKYETRWSTAMAAQSGNVTPEYFRQVFDDSVLAMIEIKKDLTEDGKEKVSVDNTLQMVTPQILNKLKNAAVKNGLEVDENLEKRLEEYTEFFNSYREKLKEEKRKNFKGITKDNIKIEPQNIEKASEEAQLSEIQAETTAIREEIIAEKEGEIAEEKQTKENSELGEQE